jgi:hypothetical protein
MISQRRGKTTLISAALLSSAALVLAACGGSDDSGGSSSPSQSEIGGGSAECTTAALEKATEDAASANGIDLVNTKDYDCADGWAIVFGITKANDIEQTTAFVFEAEGPFWVPVSVDDICNGGVDGVPASIKDQACALR